MVPQRRSDAQAGRGGVGVKPSQAVDASMRRPALTDRQKQVAAVKKKLKGRNRVHVAVLAIRLGLVSESTEGEPS